MSLYINCEDSFQIDCDGEFFSVSNREIQKILFDYRKFMEFIEIRANQVSSLRGGGLNGWKYNEGVSIIPPSFEDDMINLRWEDERGDDGYKTFSFDYSYIFMDLDEVKEEEERIVEEEKKRKQKEREKVHKYNVLIK